MKAAFEKAKPELVKLAPLDQWEPEMQIRDDGSYRALAIRADAEPAVLVPWTPAGHEVI